MTINLYPAVIKGNTVQHADNWDEGSTMYMSNMNFYAFFKDLLGEQNVTGSPGLWKTKFIADSLRMNTKPLPVHYVHKLSQIVAIAQILKAEYIAYA